MNLAPVIDRLDAAARQAADTQAVATEIGEALVAGVHQRFDDEEAPDGSSWEPSIRAREEGGKTLTDKGELRNSIGYIVSPTKVVVGSNKKYAATHQLGGVIKGKKGKLKFSLPGGGFAQVDSVTIPQREYLGISDEDRAEVQAILQQHLKTVFTK